MVLSKQSSYNRGLLKNTLSRRNLKFVNFRCDSCIIFGSFFDDFHVFWDIDFCIDLWLTFWWQMDNKRRRIGRGSFFFWLPKSTLSPKRFFGPLLVALWLHFGSFWTPLVPFCGLWLPFGSLLAPVCLSVRARGRHTAQQVVLWGWRRLTASLPRELRARVGTGGRGAGEGSRYQLPK